MYYVTVKLSKIPEWDLDEVSEEIEKLRQLCQVDEGVFYCEEKEED